VQDGDAAPLALRGARVEWRARELVLDAAAAGPHALYVGDRGAHAPAYDLAAVLARTAALPVTAAALGAIAPNPGHAARAVERPFTERHRAALALAVAALLGVLALWAFRLLRRGAEAEPPA
jgi:hypothetical protein